MPSFWYCLTVFFVSQALHLGIPIFVFQKKSCLLTFDSISETLISDTRGPRYEHFPIHHRPWLFLPFFLYYLTVFFVSQALYLANLIFLFHNKLFLFSFHSILKNWSSKTRCPRYHHFPIQRRASLFMPSLWYCLLTFDNKSCLLTFD